MNDQKDPIEEFLIEPEAAKPGDTFKDFLEAIRKPRKADPLTATENKAAKLAREHFRQVTESHQKPAKEFARAVRVSSKSTSAEDLMRQIRQETQ